MYAGRLCALFCARSTGSKLLLLWQVNGSTMAGKYYRRHIQYTYRATFCRFRIYEVFRLQD
jgi:hypothetical protein